MTTCYSIFRTARLGDLLLTVQGAELTGIYYSDRPHAPAVGEGWELAPGHAMLRAAAEQLAEFLDGKRRDFALPLRAEGTAFQKAIWRQIAMIPFGETVTYTELARRAGAPGAVRAAGAATGRNPISVVVPCHRVVGADGGMRGYAGGVERKRFLLGVEVDGTSVLGGVSRTDERHAKA